MKGRDISIWFFIGLSLFGNGVLILGAGVYELIYPPAQPTIALYKLHANVWWGAILLLVGAIYCWKFSPMRKAPAEKEAGELVIGS